MKKIISFALSIIMLICCTSVCLTAFAADGVEINATNFPDEVWRTMVSSYYDTDSNGYLSNDEASTITRMSISGVMMDVYDDDQTIEDLKGIEYFTNLSVLNCGGVGLTSLDVSKNTALTSLTCQGNSLTNLDVSKNANLETLICNANNLTSLDVSNNSKLAKLHCYANSLTSLNVNGLTGITDLNCHSNELTALNVAAFANLANIHCSYNHLKTLDLSSNTAIQSVTNLMIGSQTATATAFHNDNKFYIPFETDESHKVSGNSITFDSNKIYVNTYSDVLSGVTYNYETGLTGAESMDVKLTLDKTFYQVNFYNEVEGTGSVVSTQYVDENSGASAPTIENQLAKYFDHWDKNFSSVSSDLEVYPVWELAKAISGTVNEMSSPTDTQGTLGGVSGASVMVDGKEVCKTDSNGAFSIFAPNGVTTITVKTDSSVDRTFSVTVKNDEDVTGIVVPIVNCDYKKDGYFNARDIQKDSAKNSVLSKFLSTNKFEYTALNF